MKRQYFVGTWWMLHGFSFGNNLTSIYLTEATVMFKFWIHGIWEAGTWHVAYNSLFYHFLCFLDTLGSAKVASFRHFLFELCFFSALSHSGHDLFHTLYLSYRIRGIFTPVIVYVFIDFWLETKFLFLLCWLLWFHYCRFKLSFYVHVNVVVSGALGVFSLFWLIVNWLGICVWICSCSFSFSNVCHRLEGVFLRFFFKYFSS